MQERTQYTPKAVCVTVLPHTCLTSEDRWEWARHWLDACRWLLKQPRIVKGGEA
jgi:hypothetical protein